jgi:predicted nucleotidyltransferase
MEPQLEPLVAGLRQALGDDLVGIYLHGSAVLGGLRPRSDIDVIVIVRRPTTAEQKRRVITVLLDLSGNPRPIELDIVVHAEIRPWRYPPRTDFHYFELRRPDFEAGELEPWSPAADADLASVVTMTLAGGAALAGPPPAEVFDPVPRRDYVRAVISYLGELEEDVESDTRNVVLTLARIWSAVGSDGVHSKDSAAAWALSRLPDEPDWRDLRPQVRAYAAHVVAEIEAAARGVGV